ncbi:winged helix-turn-helix domain-containing protein [Halioxenophilus sp. WMMB6]|uniref:winged helix-turn-helix domain-containing protein n=1 Tax=Halioxenophilus sp. WMMB6 TaxID=3073815 RepID=UPI00295EA158|nr:winged helix-turn-helix domain-containing protein [Halioxenophilus sp. WMMB6]
MPLPKSIPALPWFHIRRLALYALAAVFALLLVRLVTDTWQLPATVGHWGSLLVLASGPLLFFWLNRRNLLKDGTSSPPPTSVSDGHFVIGHAELDIATRQLRFHQQPAEIQPKVFDLLVYLIQQRHRAVSKDELFDQIWPSVVVSEASLTQTVKRARDLFRKHGFEQDIIRTVSRVGYQFDYPAITGQAAVPERVTPADAKPPLLATLAAAVISLLLLLVAWHPPQSPTATAPAAASDAERARSLVVLPFTNLTPDPNFSYFTDGLTETLTNSLTQVRGLRIIARTSAYTVGAEPEAFAAIGEQLGVGHLVMGSVQRVGEQLRISTQLIRVSDGSQVWAELYNRPLDDVFSLHDEISHAIVTQLAGRLSTELAAPRPQPATVPARQSEAYLLLLRGGEYRRDGSSDSLQTATELFRQALALQPNYADAMVALADVMRERTILGELQPRERYFSEALSLATQAAQLDSQNADAWVQIGEIQHRHFWDFTAAQGSFQKALAANPGSAAGHSAYSRYLSKAGHYQQAVAEARIALDLDPLSTRAASSLIYRLIRAKQLDEARTLLEVYKQRHPNHSAIPWLETNWHIRQGSYSEALQWSALEELDYLRLSLSAITLQQLGRTDQAQAALAELIASDGDGAAFQIAEVYAQWQQPEAAFEWLERAFRQGDPGLSELYSSVNLENLYRDPRFANLAKRVGLPTIQLNSL